MPPDTMIERIARAMLADMNEYDEVADDDVDGWQSPSVREIYIRQARAAIRALMEPTDGMVRAGEPQMGFVGHGFEDNDWLGDPRDVLRAMLTAAMKETPDA